MAPVFSKPSTSKGSTPKRASLPCSCKHQGTYYTHQSLSSTSSEYTSTTIPSRGSHDTPYPRFQRKVKPSSYELFGSSEESTEDNYSTTSDYTPTSGAPDLTSPAHSIVGDVHGASLYDDDAFIPPGSIFVNAPIEMAWVHDANRTQLQQGYLQLKAETAAYEILMEDARARVVQVENHMEVLVNTLHTIANQSETTLDAVYHHVSNTQSKLAYLTSIVEDQIIDNYTPPSTSSTSLRPIKQEQI